MTHLRFSAIIAAFALAISVVPAAAQPATDDPVVMAARSWLGVPYVWGGCSRRGIDWSWSINGE